MIDPYTLGILNNKGETPLPPVLTNLISYWNFNNDITDQIGSYDLTNNGASLTSDRFGSGNSAFNYQKAGTPTDQYMWNNSYFNFFGKSACTIACWIKRNSTITGTEYIMSIPRTSINFNGFDIELQNSNAVVSIVTSAGNFFFKLPTPITNGVWYFLVATYDGTNMKFYKDASLIGAEPVTGTMLAGENDQEINFGRLGTFGSYLSDTDIDQAYVYDRALIQGEIDLLYAYPAIFP